MNLIQRLQSRTQFCFIAFTLLIAGLAHPVLVRGQSSNYTDDGNFSLYTTASVSGNGISASSTYPTPDSSLNYATYNIYGPTWSLSNGSYSESGSGSSFTTGSLPSGTYYVYFYWYIDYYYYGYLSGGGLSCDLCSASDSPTGWATVTVP